MICIIAIHTLSSFQKVCRIRFFLLSAVQTWRHAQSLSINLISHGWIALNYHSCSWGKGPRVKSVLDTTLYDDWCKECDITFSKFVVMLYLAWCTCRPNAQTMTSRLVRTANQCLRMECDIMLRLPGEKNILHTFWKDNNKSAPKYTLFPYINWYVWSLYLS